MPEPYRVAWAQLLAGEYDVDGRAWPACPGSSNRWALPPHAPTWTNTGRIYPLGATDPPTEQLPLPMPEAC